MLLLVARCSVVARLVARLLVAPLLLVSLLVRLLVEGDARSLAVARRSVVARSLAVARRSVVARLIARLLRCSLLGSTRPSLFVEGSLVAPLLAVARRCWLRVCLVVGGCCSPLVWLLVEGSLFARLLAVARRSLLVRLLVGERLLLVAATLAR